MSSEDADGLSIAPIWRGWFGACLALPALAIAAVIADEGTHKLLVRISMVGALLIVASAFVSAFARSQRRFILLTAATFALGGGALVYVLTHMREVSPVFFLDTSNSVVFLVGAFSMGVFGAALIGARLHPGGPRPSTRDGHHSALQRAGALSIVAAVATTSALTPTLFFWVPPIMLALGATVCTMVTRRDLAFERRLAAIDEGRDGVYAIVPAEKDAPELPRVTRWEGAIGGVEHGFIVKKNAGGSYREAGERGEPLMSVAIGRVARAPRAPLVTTSLASVAGLVAFIVLLLAAPMISVPSSVQTLYGQDTRFRLRSRSWYDAKAALPRGVVLYDVDTNFTAKVEHAPPFRWVGYDRTRATLLSPSELFLRLAGTNDDAEYLALAAVNLLLDAEERYSDEKAKIDRRELRFSYSSSHMGRWRRQWTKTIYRCSVNLDTAILAPCRSEEIEVPDEGSMRAPITGDGDPHHTK